MSDEDEDTLDTPGFHMFAKIGLALETLNANLETQAKNEQRRLAALPINYPFQRISNPAGVTDIVDFQGPLPGRVWIVRALAAFASPVGTNAAVVSWYIGQNMTGDAPGQLPLNMKRWEFPSLPGQQPFTSNILTVRNGEHLIAGLTSVPASSRIYLNVVVNDEPLWAQRFVVSNE